MHVRKIMKFGRGQKKKFAPPRNTTSSAVGAREECKKRHSLCEALQQQWVAPSNNTQISLGINVLRTFNNPIENADKLKLNHEANQGPPYNPTSRLSTSEPPDYRWKLSKLFLLDPHLARLRLAVDKRLPVPVALVDDLHRLRLPKKLPHREAFGGQSQ